MGAEHLWIANAHGDDIHIYEVGTWALIDHVVVGPAPHGMSVTADGAVVHVSVEYPGEPSGQIVWLDSQTRRELGRVVVGPAPHEIECTADGRWIYVPCMDGSWWVVDGVERRVVKTIETGGRPHNTTISPDGRTMYLSPMGLKTRIDGKKTYLGPREVTRVSTDTHQVIDRIPFGDHPRPAAINHAGTLLFQNVDGLAGFEIASTETGQVVERVQHTIATDLRKRKTRCHGLAITPDGGEVWCLDVDRHRVHVHELRSGSYAQVATIPLIGRCYWMVFSSDGRYAFVALRSEGKVAVIDAVSRAVLMYLAAGDTPKRLQIVRPPSE